MVGRLEISGTLALGALKDIIQWNAIAFLFHNRAKIMLVVNSITYLVNESNGTIVSSLLHITFCAANILIDMLLNKDIFIAI